MRRGLFATFAMAAVLYLIAGVLMAYPVFFVPALLFAGNAYLMRPRSHARPPDPLAALDSVPLSWADPEHPAYEPNPDVRDRIAQGVPVLQAREEVRAAGGDPDKKPHVVGPKAVATPIVPAVPAPGTTRTVRFEFDDDVQKARREIERSKRLVAGIQQRQDYRRLARVARGTYRIEVTDRHGKSHWGPPYVTREDALAAMPQAIETLNATRAAGGASILAYVQIVRLDADGKWTPC